MRRASFLGPVLLAACSAGLTAPGPPPPPGPPASASTPAPDASLRYEIFTPDQTSGHAVVVRHGDGSLDEDYEYSDRGRGPKTHTHVDVGADGAPDRVEISGKDYFKRDVHELAACGARCR